ncbi:PadR family transcriptional regulator [Brachybacterium subflavum]|uniref:PadR family transcriptional regulator n=1 Tax=Brachybacterium subflavum TaxID=2585206 RepID=UPI0012665B6F|nr:helix-turn-helix transcriptional regulator [Brachybacterium subflavum]
MTGSRAQPATGDDAPPLAPEDSEWADELAASWVEVYKKAATTLALLRLVRESGPISAHVLAPLFAEATGWSLSERGLYRSLRRLAQAGVLDVAQVEVPRTGAKRQDFSLTAVGRAYLQRIEGHVLP